jgi:hypothetical protein
LNNKTTNYVAPLGLLLSAFALLVCVLLGFGGFRLLAFGDYSISGFVSRSQLIFLTLSGLGFFIFGISWVKQAGKTKNSTLISLLYIAVSLVFFSTAIFGLTSQLRSSNFWAETSFEEIESTLFFNNLSLMSFLALGIQQITLSIIFFRNKMLGKHQLSKTIKILTLVSGIFFIIKTIIDYPIIKEAIFILSFMLKIPIPNNIISIVAPLVYLCAQILIAIILLRN